MKSWVETQPNYYEETLWHGAQFPICQFKVQYILGTKKAQR